MRDFGRRDAVQRPVDERGTQNDTERRAPSRLQLLLCRRELNQVDELVNERPGGRGSALLQGAPNLGSTLDRALSPVKELLDWNQLRHCRLRSRIPRLERSHRGEARIQSVAKLLAARGSSRGRGRGLLRRS